MLLFNTFPIWLNVFLLGLCVLDNDPLYLVVMLNNDELACLILLYPKIHYIHCYWWTLIYKKCYEAFKSSLSFNNLFWFNPNFVFASYCWLMILFFMHWWFWIWWLALFCVESRNVCGQSCIWLCSIYFLLIRSC